MCISILQERQLKLMGFNLYTQILRLVKQKLQLQTLSRASCFVTILDRLHKNSSRIFFTGKLQQ